MLLIKRHTLDVAELFGLIYEFLSDTSLNLCLIGIVALGPYQSCVDLAAANHITESVSFCNNNELAPDVGKLVIYQFFCNHSHVCSDIAPYCVKSIVLKCNDTIELPMSPSRLLMHIH